MVRLIVVRHGYSKSNESGRFTGQTDIELSDIGMLQAKKTAAYLRARYAVHSVYSSPLRRALQTARPIAEAYGCEIRCDHRLQEICGGEWEEKTFDEITALYPEAYATWRQNIGESHCTGGESMAQVQTRVLAALDDIVAENDGKTVVVVTHAAAIRALQCAYMKLPLSRMKDIPWVPNASVGEIVYDGDTFALQSIGYAEHLQGLRTALPKNV